MWWLPAAPDTRVGGILTVDPSGSCELQLTESLLKNSFWESGSVDEVSAADGPIIHGEADSEEFTIIYTFSVGGGTGSPFASQPQYVTPQAVLRGIHLRCAGQQVFNGAELEIDNLTAWSSITGFTSKVNVQAMKGETADYWVQYQLAPPTQPPVRGSLLDFKVELSWRSKFNPQVTETHTGRQLKASEVVRAKIESKTPRSWDSFIAVGKSFQDLLTFATRHPCAIRASYLLVQSADRSTTSVELIRTSFVRPKSDAEAKWQKFLFRVSDVSFPALLTKWDQLHSRIGMGVHVLFGLDYEQGGYLENRIMNAASAAEGIHRALHPQAAGLPEDDYKAELALIKAAVKDSAHSSWFLGRLRNDPGFADRMLQLAAIPHQRAVATLLEDVPQWAKWLRDARNAVAHLEQKDLDKIPEGARYQLPAVTIALLHLVFLSQLGLSAEIQTRAVGSVYAGATESFRTAVQEKLGAKQPKP